MSWTVAKLVEAARGKLVQGKPGQEVAGVSTDTRDIRPGACFVALAGDRHDGHDFIPVALDRDARAFIVSRKREELAIPDSQGLAIVEVPDTLYALGELARFHRKSHSVPVIGVSGSNGKTSTKEMIAGILGVGKRVLKNKGNFNNLIGAPLTLLALDDEHDVAVVEMGINVPGEMARLSEIVSPTVGLITNIYPAHLEGLGSLDGIMQEKGKLWTGLPENGLAVVNMDDARLLAFSKGIRTRTVTYSLRDPAADVKISGGVEIQDGVSCFRLSLGKETIPVRLSVLGDHQIQNALAAAAVCRAVGETPETIAAGLERHEAAPQRMRVHRLADGRTIIDDTYNANPGSMLAAVRTAVEACGGKPLVAVLGEMRELGPESASLHYELGRRIGAAPVSLLITLGVMAEEIGRGASDAGLPAASCRHALNHEEITAMLREECPGDAWILVKGSRGMTMERVVEGLLTE